MENGLKLTFKTIAQLTLRAVGSPLTTKEIWQEANRLNIIKDFKSHGKTPDATIGAYIYWSLKANEGIFTKIDGPPRRFGLIEFDKIKKVVSSISQETTKYYLVGTKYFNEERRSYEDYFEDMVEESVISTGYGWGFNFSNIYNNTDSIINKEVDDKIKDQKAKSTIKAFLKLKVGDIIGIKDRVRGHIKIRGYAVVVNRNGRVYSFNENLGHCIEVEFLKIFIDNQTTIGGFAKTVSQVTRIDHILAFFGEYQANQQKIVLDQIRTRRRLTRSSTNSKNVTPVLRRAIKPCIVNPKHNLIQQKFYEFLSQQYPGKVEMENNFIDVKLTLKDKCILYEIKPYSTPIECIISALGQILYYAHLEGCDKNKEIVVVGPNKEEKEDVEFINYLKKHLNVDFKYKFFNGDSD